TRCPRIVAASAAHAAGTNAAIARRERLSRGRARHRPQGVVCPTALPDADDGPLTEQVSVGRPTPSRVLRRRPLRRSGSRLPSFHAETNPWERRPGVHACAPAAARDPKGRARRLVGGASGTRAPPLQPRQGLLAGRGVHEGRPGRLLLQRLEPPAAAPGAAAAHDEADARRDRRRRLLREVGAGGRLIKQADPDKVTMAWRVTDRAGKIFIDHNMNRQGANIAAAYSLRPEPRAPVSTPLTWDEVRAGGFEPQDFRIDNVWERFATVGDLWAGVRGGPGADLGVALDALGVEVEEDDPVRGLLPRTAAPDVRTKTSDEIALTSKDPALL